MGKRQKPPATGVIPLHRHALLEKAVVRDGLYFDKVRYVEHLIQLPEVFLNILL
jgi:hypothetical protein